MPKVIVCAGRDRRTQGRSANPDRKDGVLESVGNGEPAPWSEKSTDQGITSYEKGIKMEAKIDAQSIRNRVCDVEINETGTENGIKSHEKGTKMEPKSMQNW